MRRVLEQTSLFIGIYLLVAVLRYPYITLPQQLGEMLQSQAQAAAIDMSLSDVDIDFPLTLLVRRLALELPGRGGPLPLRLSDIRCDLSGWNLLRLRLVSDCSLRGYQGQAQANVKRSLLADPLYLDARFSAVDLSSLPPLFPVELAGILNLEWQGSLATDAASAEGNFRLELDQGRYLQLQKIMGLFSVPEIQGLEAIIEGNISGRTLRLNQVQLSSSLGTAEGSAELDLDERLQPRSYRAEVELALSEQGATHFGSLLMLGSRSGGTAQTRRWQLSIEKAANSPLPTIVSSPKS